MSDAATIQAPSRGAKRKGKQKKRRARQPQGLNRDLRLPEGIVLTVDIAAFGQRIAAAAVDFILLHVLFFLLIYVVLQVFPDIDWEAGTAIIVLLLSYFSLRLGFFTVMEIGYRGMTLGKMLVGIRVIDRRGGPLRRRAIIARNLTREIEMFIPFQLALVSLGNNHEVTSIIGFAWTALFVFFPLFNRDRMRIGDLIGGTWVIEEPKEKIEEDLAGNAVRVGLRTANRHAFTPAQLEHYGIYELQTLERVLRVDGPSKFDLQREVAHKIADRIGYDRAKIGNAGGFLQDFYIAQRDRLETLMRHGDRRERKRDLNKA